MNFIKKYWVVIFIVFFISMLIKPAFCFFIIGALLFYVSFDALVFLKEIQQKGIETSGRVLSFQTDRNGHKTPIVEFTPIGRRVITGKPFIYSSTDLSKLRSYKKNIDKDVLILYHPDDPKKFVLSNEKGFNYFVFSVLTLAGLAFIILSVCSFLGYIKMG
jgi:hypothetical protein